MRARRPPVAPLFVAAAVVAFGAVVAALVSQHVFDMQPCPWCVLQRLIFLGIGVFALVGIAWRAAVGSRVAATFALLLAASGFAASMWQHFVASRSESCNLTLADRIVTGLHLDALLPDVFEARASCADAAVNLLGVPYDLWSAALFVLIAIAMVRVLRLSS